VRSFAGIRPILFVTGGACELIVAEPDLGTAFAISATVLSLLVVAGVRMRMIGAVIGLALAAIVLLAIVEPYRAARLTAFLNPWAHAASSGFQAVQGQIALGSGGLLGVGLGQSVQKVFYLPEAHTDFILAVIGEELGVAGIAGVIMLYAMVAWAGLRAARAAAAPYAKLLATGLTALILCQATLNIFVVLGLAPLTGVPLPFISYGPTNLCVVLAAMGLLLNIAAGGSVRLRVVDGGEREPRPDRDRGRRDGRARRAGPRGGRRAAG
jgi:cell division protein FtsW